MANSRAHKLRAIPGGKGRAHAEGVEELLSGQVTARPKTTRRKKELPPEEIPKRLEKLADVFAAARAIEKEVREKGDYARQQLDEFWRNEVSKQYATINRRPTSRTFSGRHSRFKFVFTERTTLTPDKTDELKDLGIPIEEHTELRGLKINYDAIRQHGLTNKLRDALASMHVSKGVLDEVFTPEVQLKETFYDILSEVVRNSLKPHENLEEKIKQVLDVLDPTTQIRNVEVHGLNAKQSFDLVNSTEIEAEEEIA